MTTLIDLKGLRFDRLTVIERAPNDKWGKTEWSCRCDCGTDRVVDAGSLRRGLIRSCGCFRREETAKNWTTHGYARTATYRVWAHLKARCSNPHDNSFRNYGGRGIRVCERWTIFENFLADMGEKPPGMTLERIDNDGGYSARNCRWASRKEQCNNTRQNLQITHNGVTRNLKQWTEETGVPYHKAYERIYKLGWDIERALLP